MTPILKTDEWKAVLLSSVLTRNSFSEQMGELKMDEQKIREAAYQLWENDGKPQGQELEHWFTAEKSAGEAGFDSSESDSSQGGEAVPSQSDFTAGTEDQNKDGR